jgi:integrase
VSRQLGQLCGGITAHQLTPLHLHSLHARWKMRMQPGGLYDYNLALRHLVKNIGASIGRPDLVDQVPRARKPSPRKTIATPGDLRKLIDASPTWLRTIILLAAHGGFRRSDCMRVAPIHYNAEARTITIDQQKTGQTVSVPVSDELAANLEAAPEAQPLTPFYQIHRGAPITNSGLNAAWHRLKTKTGADAELWLHDLRRTLAVSLYEVSKDLRVVEQMLGHTSLASTATYLEHRDPAKLKPYLDSLFVPKGPVQ